MSRSEEVAATRESLFFSLFFFSFFKRQTFMRVNVNIHRGEETHFFPQKEINGNKWKYKPRDPPTFHGEKIDESKCMFTDVIEKGEKGEKKIRNHRNKEGEEGRKEGREGKKDSIQFNFICIALNHSYSLKGLYRPYDYYGPCDYDTPPSPITPLRARNDSLN